MHEPSANMGLITFVILGVILAIFAMKYASQMLATHADLRLEGLEQDAKGLHKRIAHLEAMLKDVE